MNQSAIYTGILRHRRFGTPSNHFTYPLFMLYLDLDEIPRLFRKNLLWSAAGPNLAWFRRKDYLGPSDLSLKDAVADRVAREAGIELDGPIRMLTHLRFFGFCFNPVTFYYCFDREGSQVRTIVAEITNTPWGERHAYVLHRPDAVSANGTRRFSFAKDFHVSPFMPMDHDYRWYFSPPDDRLLVHMTNLQRKHPDRNDSGVGTSGRRNSDHRNSERGNPNPGDPNPGDPEPGNPNPGVPIPGNRVFDVDLQMRREPMNTASLRRVLARFPFITLQVLFRIYWQALKLRVKKARFYEHPKKGPQSAGSTAKRSTAWKGP